MNNKNGFPRFVRGAILVALALVVAAAIIVPAIGLAQGGRNNLNAPQEADASATGRTDDPQGRLRIPLPDDAAPTSNKDVTAGAQGMGEAVSGPEAAALEAQAIESYGSPLVIPGADFRSDGFDPSGFFFWFGGGYAYGEHTNSCLMAPAYLPNGATVEAMFVSMRDNDPAAHIYVRLYRVNNFDGAVDVMADVTTTDAYADPNLVVLSDSPVDFPFILYPDYSYYVGTCLASTNIHLYSVRLYYTQ